MGDSSLVPARRGSISLLLLSLALAFLASGCASANKSALLSPGAKTPPAAVEAKPSLTDGADNELMAAPLVGETAAAAGQPATAHNVLKTAFSQVGVPYRYGGHKPDTGFDCSGFTRWVFGQFGFKLARSSGDQLAHGKSVARNDLRPGDLVFFGRKKRITHVGIYTGGGKYIHSPSSGKRVQESDLDDRARGEYYAGARRIINNQGAHISDAQKLAWAPKKHQSLALAKIKGQTKTKTVQAPAKSAQVTAQAAAPKLQVPTSAAPAIKTSKIEARPASVTAANPKKARKHKVTSGDTLYGLARKYGVSANTLAKVNNLDTKQMAMLKLGQTLMVPQQ